MSSLLLPITVELDRKRAIRWTRRAEARMASLARPVSFTDLRRRKRATYALCAIIWAALVEKDHGFDDPEELAEFLFEKDEQHLAALKAINAMIAEAYPEKKSEPSGVSSTSGPPTSSSVASAPPPSTHGS